MANPTHHDRPAMSLRTVNIDCGDAKLMADFYGRLLGWEITLEDGNFILMRDPAGGTGLSFQELRGYREPTWPEQPAGQDKMLHLEIKVDDLGGAVRHALACGGRLAEFQGRDDLRVILDPSGHPLCLFTV